MRIISGSARRTVLEVAAGSDTRPLLEMARGALFNSLGERVAEASVLDLYAGSGALGLEALSRGAKSCLFVERDRAAAAALARNIAKCRMRDRAEARM
ncbi:MAG: RsmD family RNA methyltransferase, partial [Planctomycetota bacterium]|nr:RsmD family RNA methyltransferase [Planctomycetota bacterium]